jgi:hypothetical protein
MWYLLQGGIIFAVVSSNIHWHWTRNMYLASIAGWLAAYVATGLINKLRGIEPAPPRPAFQNLRRSH